MNRLEIIATGPEFTGRGIRSFESVLEEIVKNAQKEIQIASYTISPSAIHILELLKIQAEKGVKISLIVNDIKSVDDAVKKFFSSVKKRLSGVFSVYEFHPATGRNLHAKVAVVDRNQAILGSANLSWGGFASNCELGIFVEGEIAWKIARILDDLSLRCHKV